MDRFKIEVVQHDNGEWSLNFFEGQGECANGDTSYFRRAGYFYMPTLHALDVIKTLMDRVSLKPSPVKWKVCRCEEPQFDVDGWFKERLGYGTPMQPWDHDKRCPQYQEIR